MKTFFYRHFPKNKTSWKKYLVVFLPIIISSTIIALNGMIDNFMVGKVDQGSTALGAVNSWTNIYTGLVLATAAAGSIGYAQFYYSGNYKVVKEIARIRFMINITGAIILFIMVWTARDWMIGLFMSHHPVSLTHGASLAEIAKANTTEADYQTALDNAQRYIKITSVQWLIYSVSYDLGSQLRETGYAKITLYTSIIMLTYHITLNVALLYGANMGIEGPAIAGATSRVIPITVLSVYIYRKKLNVGIRPWTLFQTSKKALFIILKRYVYWLSVFTVTFFITYRNHFWDLGYPVGEGQLGTGVSGLAVLALTGAIMNIFTTTFAAAPAMAANFVASELGKGNLEQAKINSDEIKGFNTVIASCLAVLLLAFSFIVPHMTFMASAGENALGATTDAKAFLEQVSHSTATISFWYPIWIWFVSGYRNSQAGGKGSFSAIVDWVVSGPIQLGWLALMVTYVVPNSEYMQTHFWLSYFIFFTSDLLKLIFMEIFYYRYTWLNSLTKPESNHPVDHAVTEAEVKHPASASAKFFIKLMKRKK